MKKIDFGQTITILANLGVIAGIVFLAIEVSQNQESLDQANVLSRAEILGEALEFYNEERSMRVQDDELILLWDRAVAGEQLTPLEARKFQLMCENSFWVHATIHQRYVLLGEDDIAASGPAATARSDMETWDKLEECWAPLLEVARNWGYASFADALQN